MLSQKSFVFMYPQPEIFEHEIRSHAIDEGFEQRYKTALNRCIDERYRKKGLRFLILF